MSPTDFHESNVHLAPPAGMEETCGYLHVYTNGEVCISCWKPTKEELARLVAGEPVWLTIVSGHTQPPVAVSVDSPFCTIDQTRERN